MRRLLKYDKQQANKGETMAELMYKVVVIDLRKDEDNTFALETEFGEWGWKLCMDAYKTEMSFITGQPESHFEIERGYTALAVTQDKRVIGIACLYPNKIQEDMIIGHVYVRPKFREKGVYKTMMGRIEKFAKDTGMKKIVAFAHRSNGGSMKAHHKLGFKQQIVGYLKEVDNG